MTGTVVGWMPDPPVGEPLPGEPLPGVPEGDSVPVSQGRVSVTVVGVAAQCVQTVTVVVQPSGGAVVCAGTFVGPFVTVGVAEAVAGQYVVVYVVVMVVKPVGQMLVYEVTMTVVMVSGAVVVPVALTPGADVIPDVTVGVSVPLCWWPVEVLLEQGVLDLRVLDVRPTWNDEVVPVGTTVGRWEELPLPDGWPELCADLEVVGLADPELVGLAELEDPVELVELAELVVGELEDSVGLAELEVGLAEELVTAELEVGVELVVGTVEVGLAEELVVTELEVSVELVTDELDGIEVGVVEV